MNRPHYLPSDTVLKKLMQFLAESVANDFSDKLGLLVGRNCHCTHGSLVDYYIDADNEVYSLPCCCKIRDETEYLKIIKSWFRKVIKELNMEDIFDVYYSKVLDHGFSMEDIPYFHLDVPYNWQRLCSIFYPRNSLKKEVIKILIQKFRIKKRDYDGEFLDIGLIF